MKDHTTKAYESQVAIYERLRRMFGNLLILVLVGGTALAIDLKSIIVFIEFVLPAFGILAFLHGASSEALSKLHREEYERLTDKLENMKRIYGE